jgi:hypothetical protein
MEGEQTPCQDFCGSNVNRAEKEINAFEWEGDYWAEARNRLKELLEERLDEELE